MGKKRKASIVEPPPEVEFDDASSGFNSDEPLDVEDDGPLEEAPPLTYGVDSTRPTPFDKLPWKTVALPEVGGDVWGFDGEGGLLGLEELDGEDYELWRSSRDAVEELEDETEPADAEPSAEDEEAKALREKKAQRKAAKKERQAAARLAKKQRLETEGQSPSDAPGEAPEKTTAAATVNGKDAKKPQAKDKVQNANDDPLLKMDWAATADLDLAPDADATTQLPTLDLASVSFDSSLLPSWGAFKLAPAVKKALHTLGFNEPTKIQSAVLDVALNDPKRDIVAVAETGSGKTLAYALPIVNSLLSPKKTWSPADEGALPIAALVLTPTRELCLQVRDHIDRLLSSATPSAKGKEPLRNRSGIPVVAVCGGIAAVKHRRLLSLPASRGTILVATPGRLWDLVSSWDELARGIRNVGWVVVDEADRMTERGKYEEMEKIARLTRRSGTNGEGQEGFADEWGGAEKEQARENIRTMVFSATMDVSLQKDIKRRTRWRRGAEQGGQLSALDGLLEKLDFRDPAPEVVDLSPQGKVVEGLKECKVECVTKEKDLYLYHFLIRYPGRTLVFLSSIAALRRLAPLLTLLLPSSRILTLHSSMQQRSRLKSLDAFRSSPSAVLLATDVAARGLDVPQVEHVVHCQVPRRADGYVHRSGRTARAGSEGVSLVMIGPDELGAWKALMRNLGRVDDLDTLPFEHSILDKLRERLELAKRIDDVEHTASKQAHDDNWIKKTADAMDIEIDSDDDPDRDHVSSSKRASKAATVTRRRLRADLTSLLSRPLILGGVKQGRYLTGGDEVVRALVNGEGHRELVGLRGDLRAGEELNGGGKRKKQKRKHG